MKIPDLKKDSIIKTWLDTVSIRATTLNSYLLGMQHFTEFTNQCPEELLRVADTEQDANLKPRSRAVNRNLNGFRNYLQGKELAPLSIKAYINGVKSFYRAFDIDFKDVQFTDAGVLQENKQVPTINDIRDILKVCDPLEKTLILVGCSSGLDGATISNLKIKDFKKGYDSVTGITTLELRRLKTGVDFVTFLTPEASEAVLNYLTYRARTVDTVEQKRLNQLQKQKVNADSNYLFILRKIHADYLKDFDENRRKLNSAALMKIYRDISSKANKNTAKGQFNFIRSHNFRKFFDSTMLNNGCDYFHTEEFMGHALPGTQGHYYTYNIEELKSYYSKFIPFLTINKQINISDAPEFKALKNESERYKALAQKYFVDGLELIEIKHELAIEKSKNITPEEKKQALIEWVKKMQPANENEERAKDSLRNILGLD